LNAGPFHLPVVGFTYALNQTAKSAQLCPKPGVAHTVEPLVWNGSPLKKKKGVDLVLGKMTSIPLKTKGPAESTKAKVNSPESNPKRV
jgi:hypothetical protein